MYEKVLISVLTFAIAIIMGVINANADSYDIKNYDVNAAVQKDGSVWLTQKIRYDFDGSFHGVYYNQDIKGIDGVSDVSVEAIEDGNVEKIPLSDKKINNTFSQTKSTSQLKLKVYHSVEDKEVTFVYRYLLHGVIKNYKDTAELNWKIIGSKWDVALNNVKINIELPKKNITRLQAWTHGDLSGKTTVSKKQGTVEISLKRNPANTFVESHIVFPVSVTALNQNTSEQNALKAIQRKERALALEANEKRKREEQNKVFFKKIMFVLMIIMIALWFLWSYMNPGNKGKKKRPIVHSYEIPRLSPEVTQVIYRNKKPDTAAFSAFILKRAASHQIEVKELSEKKKDFNIILRDVKLIHNYGIFREMFNNVGDGNQFTLSELKRFGKKGTGGKQLFDAYCLWQKNIVKAADKTGYKDNQNISLRKKALAWLIAVTLVGVGTLFLFANNFLMCGLLAILYTVFLFSCIHYYRSHSLYSEKGKELKYQIMCFRKMLDDIGNFDMKKVGDLVLWEQILPYAVSLGLASKVIAALRINFDAAELSTMGVYYPLLIGGNWNFNDALTTSLGSAITNYNSSASGGSGGFSGGSSGGFGGGSGGGAF
ncbi:DUF2207 domain-containing protein [Liquorilactobacillus mali]|uniref:DUF2207 domain-containing protein n=1 Tax=Liquorilactobacillus mali TaxID=1618 RepID=UPI0026531571|nr:DUF2207 domain-containing protein [Liquorilactobacillus mali]MDN7145511.1 DUF2207 domain-containing protein [Liquorilactobacillus mali]